MILLGEKKGVIGSNVFSWMLAELQARPPWRESPLPWVLVGIGFNILNSR